VTALKLLQLYWLQSNLRLGKSNIRFLLFGANFGFRKKGGCAEKTMYTGKVRGFGQRLKFWPDILLTFALRFGIKAMAG